ncbi:MAG: 50S ribosomal protein L24 [Candidatus Neomarinimicrobiota bacterium]|nr:MAG: 50S ribosomal protein L24 [bacterium]|tara:strand:- start:330 stop:638 length:309 start_codon:yes stop_codon:yes gene_type:complete
MHLRKGMLVRVIKGNHKGSEGKLLFVFPKENRAIVEGVNMVKHSVRPTQENPSGGYSEKEAPINLSNLMLVQKGEITRIGYKILDDGSKVRISLKTGQEIEV